MNFLNILYAVLVLGALGVIFGLILAFSSKIFAVKKDDRFDHIIEVLPGANCGGCGYAGCSAYAKALVEGNAEINSCPVGGEKTMTVLAEILGVELKKNERLTALVRCSGGEKCAVKYNYVGLTDCVAANKLAGGFKECKYGCLGLGTCVSACPFGAISVKNGVAVVDHDKCTGCLKCVKTCPRGIIIPVPYTADVNVACASHEKGGSLRKICEIGCLGCKICVKTCPYGAINVEDNLAAIDYSKCMRCGACAKACPRHLIVDSNLKGPEVVENSKVKEQSDGDSAEK